MKGSLYFTLCFLLLLTPIFPFYAQQQIYRLGFETPTNHENSITENGHEFYFKSKTVHQFAHSGEESWQCNEKDGNFGSINMMIGTFNLHSLWLKRPWGTYAVTFCGFKKNVLKYKNTLLVGNESQQIKFEDWDDLDSLTIESAQKFNQLYVDDLEYSCFSCENTEIQPKNLDANLDSENSEQVSEHIILSEKQSLLDFDQIFGNESWVVSQERHFIVHSKVFSHLGFQGSRAWQCNDGQGNLGSLKIEKGFFDLHSFQIRRPWGKFETVIKGFRNDTLLYTSKVLVADDFQEVKFDNWLSINEIKIESEKPYNQLYIDNLVYVFDSLGKNNQQKLSLDSVRPAPDFVKLDSVRPASDFVKNIVEIQKIEEAKPAQIEISEISKKMQEITFLPLKSHYFIGEKIDLQAKSSSDLPVKFTVISGKAIIENNKIIPLSNSTIEVKAEQEGDLLYKPASTSQKFYAKTSIMIEDQFSNRLHKGEELRIDFTVQEYFDAQNQFELLISDVNGNFENAKILAKTSNHQLFFKFQIPYDLDVGNGYRLRIRATKPQRMSLTNENDLTIRGLRLALPSIKKNMNVLISSSLNDNQWYLNGKVMVGETQAQLQVKTDGIYTVEVNTVNGKMMSKPLEIKAEDPDQVLVSNAPMSPRQIVAKAILDKNKIRIFPNPNKGRFSLELDEDKIKALHVSIISSDDREVFQNTLYYINWYRQDVDISYEKAGIYLIKITTDKGSYSCLLNLRK